MIPSVSHPTRFAWTSTLHFETHSFNRFASILTKMDKLSSSLKPIAHSTDLA
jgi:hypothetical protein